MALISICTNLGMHVANAAEMHGPDVHLLEDRRASLLHGKWDQVGQQVLRRMSE
jgi:hypothetical protein